MPRAWRILTAFHSMVCLYNGKEPSSYDMTVPPLPFQGRIFTAHPRMQNIRKHMAYMDLGEF